MRIAVVCGCKGKYLENSLIVWPFIKLISKESRTSKPQVLDLLYHEFLPIESLDSTENVIG